MKTYTKEEIKKLLETSNKAIERGFLAIFKFQTSDEQQAEYTKYHNNKGFSAFDAKRGSYYAKWIQSGKHLSGRHLEAGRKLILRYAGQLVDIANNEKINKVHQAKDLLRS